MYVTERDGPTTRNYPLPRTSPPGMVCPSRSHIPVPVLHRLPTDRMVVQAVCEWTHPLHNERVTSNGKAIHHPLRTSPRPVGGKVSMTVHNNPWWISGACRPGKIRLGECGGVSPRCRRTSKPTWPASKCWSNPSSSCYTRRPANSPTPQKRIRC
jgi:hypothetical protein